MVADTIEKEVERKLDIPLSTDEKSLLTYLQDLIVLRHWQLLELRILHLDILYYDTPDLKVYHAGDTIRRISGFPQEMDPPAGRRYDLKRGPVSDRSEKKHWAEDEYDLFQIVEALGCKEEYPLIIPVARADTKHTQFCIDDMRCRVEITLDEFWIRGGGQFRELELELEHGPRDTYDLFCDDIKKRFALQEMAVQKYARVMRCLQR